MTQTLKAPRRIAKVRVGSSMYASGSGSFNGYIGSIVVYARVLSPLEAKQLYMGTRSKFR